MGWYGPRGNCGCCGSLCSCPNSDHKYPSFRGDPAIEVEISGVPDYLYFEGNHPWVPFTPTQRENELTGMGAINGTYFFPLNSDDGCALQLPYSDPISVPLTYSYVQTIYNASTCQSGSPSSNSGACSLDLTVTQYTGHMFQAELNISGGNALSRPEWVNIQNTKTISCPEDWDYTKTPGTVNYGGPRNPNFVGGGPAPMSNAFLRSDDTIVLTRGYYVAHCSWPGDTGNPLGVPNYGPGYHPFGTMRIWLRDL